MTNAYLRDPVSNGNPREQALIRRWWHEQEGGQGLLVWEYYLEGRYVDAIWFPKAPELRREEPGDRAPTRFPISSEHVVLCEAKFELTPELVGQALVYTQFAIAAGGRVERTIVFSEKSGNSMKRAATELGLITVVTPL